MNVAHPANIEALTGLVRQCENDMTFIAGGTDLIIARQQDGLWPGLTIDISRTEGLAGIDADADGLRIGAGVTMAALIKDPMVRRHAPILAQAAAHVGSVQIRNRATLGGNIASAMPAADLLPVLKCLDAKIEIIRQNGQRNQLGLDQVVLGRGQTCLGNGDLITAIQVPAKGTVGASAFVKLGPREVLTIAMLNLAALARFDAASNHLSSLRIVAGALGPTPLRLNSIEAMAQNRKVDQQFAEEFISALIAEVDHAIPGRASQPFKRHAIAGLGLDLLTALFGVEFDYLTQMEPQA